MLDPEHKQALPPGHQLGHYRLLKVLGVGGFGVTYLGEHISLGHQVAVKEYLPNEFAVREGATVHPKSPADREDFEWGLSRFVDEARTLTRFRHPNLVRVSDYFEANSTAYIIMDYEEGESLDRLLQRLGTLMERQLMRVLLPVADGLRQVHAAGFLHRDIKPSNVFVRRSDESPVLLDFGSARQALGRKSKSMTAIASAGYSPPEQYESQGAQGPWTDIYALSALCHRAITGETPMEAPRRQSQLLRSQVDPLPRLAEAGVAGYSPAFLEAVDQGLRVIETERPQSLDEWLAQWEEDGGAKPPKASAHSEGRKTLGRPGADKPRWFGVRAAWLAGAAGAAIGVGLYFALTYSPPKPFTVAATPLDASVEILGIAEAYRAGMLLEPGDYQVRVSAPSYEAKEEMVQHGASGPTVHRVELERLLEVGVRFRDCAECPEMVVVPAGSFLMGSPDTEEGRLDQEGPVHRVMIGSPFAVGVYEVTVAEFGRFVDATGHSTGNACYVWTGNDVELKNGLGWRNPGFGQGGSHPAVCVSWEDAQAYVAYLSRIAGERYRLPSEAEWEYAARAGTRVARWWGEGESDLCTHANGADASTDFGWAIGCNDGHSYTAPVGSFHANAWGLHDVLGNAWEWTEDCWNGNYRSAPGDGSAWKYGDCNGRVLRGGSWIDGPRNLRSANRSRITTALRYIDNGFRVARTLTP